MRIVCWNMQGSNTDGRLGSSRDILKNCLEKLGADILIILEAPRVIGSLSSSSSNERILGGYEHVYSFGGAHPSFRSDRILVCSTKSIDNIRHELTSGQLVYNLTFKTGGRTITTFHAPYEKATADTFVSKTFQDLEKLAPPPDLVIGDYNTHGTSLPTSAKNYTLTMHADTSNKGCGSPLDKIATREGVGMHMCGRFIHADATTKKQKNALSATDQTSGKVEDKEVDWHALEVPDHVAIYIDLADDATPAASSSSSHSQVAPEKLWSNEIDFNRLDSRIDDLRKQRKLAGGTLPTDLERELESALARRKKLQAEETKAAAAASSTSSDESMMSE